MKLVTFIILSGLMQIHAAVYSKEIFTFRESGITVKEVFYKIERSGDYTIGYRPDRVNLDQKGAALAEGVSIEAVIKSLRTESSQPGAISGTVTDEAGEPLIGASIVVKGTANGASTDVQGRFSLRVTGTGTTILVVKYIGFQQKEVTARAGQSGLKITLTAEASALSEVVVVGYGTVRRRDLTGAVASVKSDDITRMPTHNVADAIQGKIPGADIVRSSGIPGAGANITIRGTKSIANREDLATRNQPLYIIDGFQGGDISALNPNDIESIDVLKDASSTAIYGAQGANGVVIVTTKKGSAGKTKISYSGFYGVNSSIYPELRIGDSYIQLRRDAGKAANIWQSPADDEKIFAETGEFEAYQNGQWIDWYDLLLKDGTQQSHSVSMNGGSEKTKIAASLGYFGETGILRNSDYNRYNGRFNLDQSISKWVKAGLQTQITYSKQNVRRDPLAQAMSIGPQGTAYNANGQVDLFPLQAEGDQAALISPLADEAGEFIARDNRLNTNIIANGYVELNFLKGFTFRTNFGTNFTFRKQGIYNDKKSLDRYDEGVSLASVANEYNRFINWDNVLTYNKVIKDHNLTLTGITSYLQSDEDETYAEGRGQLLASQLYNNLAGSSTAAGDRTIRSPYEGWNNIAYAGRLNYSYKSKYLLTLSGRFDGASRLAEGNKWDFFPSAAVGWNVSDENFFSKLKPVFSNLKLRASYGVSGNYNVSVYGTQSLLVPNIRMGFGDVPAPAYQFEGKIYTASLGWEKSAATNIGLDMAFLNNRITATVDLYNTITSDIILPRDLPLSTGVTSVFQNIGETRNKGIELAINSNNIQTRDFRWSSTLTFSKNKEEITELVSGTDIIATSGTEENSLLLGHPVSSFYTYKKLGIWQASEAEAAAQYRSGSTPFKPGDIKLEDLNGDNILDSKDYTFVGASVPEWVGGLQNSFSYKAFDLNFFLVARVGQTIDAEFLGRYNPSGTGNSPESIDYWTPENPTNDFPAAYWGRSLNAYTGYQSLTYIDGSYVKLRNVTLGYTLPKNIANKISASRLRIYATASNLFTITKSHLLKNYDPERGGSESSPLNRQFVVGLNFDL